MKFVVFSWLILDWIKIPYKILFDILYWDAWIFFIYVEFVCLFSFIYLEKKITFSSVSKKGKKRMN